MNFFSRQILQFWNARMGYCRRLWHSRNKGSRIRHHLYYQFQVVTYALQMDFANQLVYHPILALTKISILVFYYRLSVSGTFRQVVMALIVTNVALTMSIFFADFFQCSPINYIWDKSIEGGKCINTEAFFISSAALNIVSDFAVLLLPIPMVWKLKINMKKKIVLILLFSLGGL